MDSFNIPSTSVIIIMSSFPRLTTPQLRQFSMSNWSRSYIYSGFYRFQTPTKSRSAAYFGS